MRIQISQPTSSRLYHLTIRDDTNNTWSVDHTYTDFFNLRQHLVQNTLPNTRVPPVPPKRYFHNNTTIQERLLAFSYLMEWILATNALSDPVVAEFLELGDDYKDIAQRHADMMTKKSRSNPASHIVVQEERRKMRSVISAGILLLLIVWLLSLGGAGVLDTPLKTNDVDDMSGCQHVPVREAVTAQTTTTPPLDIPPFDNEVLTKPDVQQSDLPIITNDTIVEVPNHDMISHIPTTDTDAIPITVTTNMPDNISTSEVTTPINSNAAEPIATTTSPHPQTNNAALYLIAIACMIAVASWAYMSHGSPSDVQPTPPRQVPTQPSQQQFPTKFELALQWVDDNDALLSDDASARVRAYAWRATGFDALAPSRDDPLRAEVLAMSSANEAQEMLILYVESLKSKPTSHYYQPVLNGGGGVPSSPIPSSNDKPVILASPQSFDTSSVSVNSTPQHDVDKKVVNVPPPPIVIDNNKQTSLPPPDHHPNSWSQNLNVAAITVGIGMLAVVSNPAVRRRVSNMLRG